MGFETPVGRLVQRILRAVLIAFIVCVILTFFLDDLVGFSPSFFRSGCIAAFVLLQCAAAFGASGAFEVVDQETGVVLHSKIASREMPELASLLKKLGAD